MYIARFSYSFKPVDRDQALALLAKEVEAAGSEGMDARLLIPLTRPPGGAALQYELVFESLDAFESFREQGVGGEAGTRDWLRDLSSILLEPPAVELLRISQVAGTGEAG